MGSIKFYAIAVCTIIAINVACADDSRNITRMLNNQVLVSKQIMCVLEKSPCDQLGRQLKGKSLFD